MVKELDEATKKGREKHEELWETYRHAYCVVTDGYNKKIRMYYWMAIISCLLSLFNSIRCFVYCITIDDLKESNEAKIAQIERLEKELEYYKEENNENTN